MSDCQPGCRVNLKSCNQQIFVIQLVRIRISCIYRLIRYRTLELYWNAQSLSLMASDLILKTMVITIRYFYEDAVSYNCLL